MLGHSFYWENSWNEMLGMKTNKKEIFINCSNYDVGKGASDTKKDMQPHKILKELLSLQT